MELSQNYRAELEDKWIFSTTRRLKNVAGWWLAVLLICILWKLKLGNKPMTIVGKRSLYVYIVHLGVLSLIQAYSLNADVNAGLAVGLLVIATIVFVEVFYQLEAKVKI